MNNLRGKDLYAFWGERLLDALNADLRETGSTESVNLASEEYFKAVKPKKLALPVIQPVFEDWSGGKFKVVSFYAKRARGSMARFALKERLSAASAESLTGEGYALALDASDEQRWVFRRRLSEK